MARLKKEPVDYVVIAVSPALIMTLVGSLVFFLLHIFYQGHFVLRLHYVLALFVFAAVLIARIGIDEGREYACWFAVPLGLATLLVMGKFVTIESGLAGGWAWPVNFLMMGVIWWCADKLTWDCTLIDEQQRDSGRGLLESVGLDEPPPTNAEPEEDEVEGTTSRDGLQADATGNWWARHVERKRRPHAPGVWVVYFSLASLPIFGLGQAFVPPSGRSYTFNLLFVYVASALGLLLTTSFLGLRRYLRQRRIEMPPAMANAWLMVGGALIVGLLFFATLLPRPDTQSFADQLPFSFGSPDRNDSSRHAPGNDGTDKQDYGRPTATEEPAEDEPSATVDSSQGESSSEGDGQGDAKQEGQPSSEQNDPSGKSSDGGDSESGDNGQSENQSPGEETPSEESPGDPQEPADSGESQEEQSGTNNSGSPKPDEWSNIDPRADLASEAMNHVNTLFGGIYTVSKWIFFLAVGIITLWCLWQSREEIIRAIYGIVRTLRELWQRLFGGRSHGTEEIEAAEEKVVGPAPRLFATYSDPFTSGVASELAPDELVRYTFEALEAWAREHGFPRDGDCTPHEFAQTIAGHVEPLAQSTRRLADLYCAVAYAPGTVRREKVLSLRELWEGLRAVEAVEA